MRKVLVGALAGLALIGGQAVAAGARQPLRMGDRVGATAGPSSRNFDAPAIVWLTVVAVIVAGAAYGLTNEDKSRSA